MATLRRAHDDDRGTSLAELIIGMALLAIFMAMFTTAIVMMSSTVNKVEAVTNSSTQVNNAFLRLDRTVRYAAGISTPAKSSTSGDWHVEFVTSSNEVDTCTQLRVDSGQLQQRTWTVNDSSYTGLSSWTPLASNVTNGSVSASSADVPFAIPAAAASASSGFQQLTITVVASSGTNTTAPTRSSFTFTALNSSASSTSPVCNQVTVDQSS